MNTLIQRAPKTVSKYQKGWITGPYSSKPRKAGWITSTELPHSIPKHQQPEQYQSSIPSQPIEAITVNCQSLSARLVDTLAQSSLDWISLLSDNWRTEPSIFSLANVGSNREDNPLIIDTWIQDTPLNKHYLSILHNKEYWVYTHCLYSPELGQVRFVACHHSQQQPEKYAAFITNRLDWSPSKIISQCLQDKTWLNLLETTLV